MLKFVFGRSGCGKSDYVFNQIKELAICGENNILLLTPEQYSLVAERRLLNDLGEDKVNCVDNSSFSRARLLIIVKIIFSCLTKILIL